MIATLISERSVKKKNDDSGENRTEGTGRAGYTPNQHHKMEKSDIYLGTAGKLPVLGALHMGIEPSSPGPLHVCTYPYHSIVGLMRRRQRGRPGAARGCLHDRHDFAALSHRTLVAGNGTHGNIGTPLPVIRPKSHSLAC